MPKTLDLNDLSEEDAKFVETLVSYLKERLRIKKATGERKEVIKFASWPLGVKGKLTREEIYDHL